MCQTKAQGGKRCAMHQPATRAMIAAAQATHGMDRLQCEAVFSKTLKRAKPPKNPPSATTWEAFLDTQIQRLALDMGVNPTDFDAAARKLNAAKATVPDPALWAACQDLDARMAKATSALRRQVGFAAAFRGVPTEVAQERYNAYRAQYLSMYARAQEADRPDPPPSWVTGFTSKDMMAVSAPADRATLYALYRCQADPDAFESTDVRYASIDLETAGPDGKDGFNPVNGSIIEVGIVEYDNTGAVTDQYETLIAPAYEVAALCGTGAVAVHGITLDDVRGAPDWSDVAPEVSRRLDGRIMLAQNARFEGEWLGHHMTAAEQDFERWGPTLDTMCVAKQHYPDLENHKLATICARAGVTYTNGHRAMHDAEVAAATFFAMRREVFAEYRTSMVRATAAHPPAGAGATTKRSPLTRLAAGDFSPTTVHDPWLLPTPAATSTAA